MPSTPKESLDKNTIYYQNGEGKQNSALCIWPDKDQATVWFGEPTQLRVDFDFKTGEIHLQSFNHKETTNEMDTKNSEEIH